MSVDLAEMGETLGIQFVCFPVNATHLVQQLDIAVLVFQEEDLCYGSYVHAGTGRIIY